MSVYSIWLMPSDSQYRKLSNQISRISQKHQTPSFEPHLTLLENIQENKQNLKNFSTLSKQMKPLKLKLKELKHKPQPRNMCLYSLVKLNKQLSQCYNVARCLFKKERKDYIPHLSMAYGNLPKQTKEKLIKELDIDKTIIFDKLYFYKTTGKENTWHKIKECKLNN